MSNSTGTTWLQSYDTHDLELVNIVQSGASFIATMIIMVKVLDIPSWFSSIRRKRDSIKKAKERKELERVRKLINSVKAHGDVVDIDELLSDDDEETEQPDAGVMRIAHKKKRQEEKV